MHRRILKTFSSQIFIHILDFHFPLTIPTPQRDFTKSDKIYIFETDPDTHVHIFYSCTWEGGVEKNVKYLNIAVKCDQQRCLKVLPPDQHISTRAWDLKKIRENWKKNMKTENLISKLCHLIFTAFKSGTTLEGVSFVIILDFGNLWIYWKSDIRREN